MIQDIHPHKFDNSFDVITSIREDDFVFHFNENSLLLKTVGVEVEIPKKKDLAFCPSAGIFLFKLDHVCCFLVWDCQPAEKSQLAYEEIKFRHTFHQKEIDYCTSVAMQLRNWYVQNKFCGKCGARTALKKDERAIVCPSCDSILFPNISPAIIVAILCGDKILLARGVNFPEGYFSLVAGYVDIGESIEDAIVREVKEEVGIEINQIQYYKSQPWPFSGSMMLGFIAHADKNQKIRIDDKEIAEAAWFHKDSLPNHPPDRSIAGEIIEKFENGELV